MRRFAASAVVPVWYRWRAQGARSFPAALDSFGGAAPTILSRGRAYGVLAKKATTGGAPLQGGDVGYMDGPSQAAVTESPTTYLDWLDAFWNRKWLGTIDESTEGLGAHTAADVDAPGAFADAFLAVQGSLGVEAWAVLLLFGGLTRLFTLAFSFYGERASARMQLALPELKGPQEAFNKVYYNDLSTALDVQLAATALKSERRRVFAKYDTSNAKCLASLASSPFIVYGVYQVSRICESHVLDVGTSSFLWCAALTLPDPCYILPTAFCALTLLNFELSISSELKKGWMSNIIWGARLGFLCVVPVAATFRAGVCLYFIGMSLAGLLQPILLRVPALRRALRFPDPAAQQPLPETDELQARMTVQFPYLGHLLSPEVVEDNTPLVTSAGAAGGPAYARGARTTTARGRTAGPVTAEGRRYAAGANPLMREVPLNKQTSTVSRVAEKPAAPGAVSGKGSSFASSGWKSANVTFSEEDFIPASFENAGPSGKSPPK